MLRVGVQLKTLPLHISRAWGSAVPLRVSTVARGVMLSRNVTTTTTSPFLTSVSLSPISSSSAGKLSLTIKAPDLPLSTVEFLPNESFSSISNRLTADLGATRVKFLVAGVTARGDAALASAFGRTLELEIDRVRYSVNGGLRLGPTGLGVPRNPALRTAFWWGGGAVLTVAIVSFWKAVLPEGHSRI